MAIKISGYSGDLRDFVIKVLHPKNSPNEQNSLRGTGFLCHPEGYALTCWHVIKPWLDKNSLTIDVIHQGQAYQADLLHEYSLPEADIAVLKLKVPETAPAGNWDFLPLDTYWRVELNDCLQSFGYPAERFDNHGIPIAAHVGGLTPTRIEGIEAYPITGLNCGNISGGYSGAPLVNQSTQRVIGLIYAAYTTHQAFIIPLNRLFEHWKQIRDYHDLYAHIRRDLGRQAQQKLDAQLNDNEQHKTPFIPLKLECGVIPEQRKQEPDKEAGAISNAYDHGREWQPFDRKRLLSPQGRFVLSSDVGTGKTTFLYSLAAELAECTDKVPVLLSCRELEVIKPLNWENFKQAFIDSHKSTDYLKTDWEAFFDVAWKKKQLIFLFDGLDQIEGDSPSRFATDTIFNTNIVGDNSVFMTSRPSAVLGCQDRKDLSFLRLLPFTPQDQKVYFGEHYDKAKHLAAIAPELTRVPVLAHMIRTLIIEGETTRIATRTQLYKEFVRHILAKHSSNKPIYDDQPDHAQEVETTLQRLAFSALSHDEPKIQKIPQDFYRACFYPAGVPVKLTGLTTFGLVNRILDRDDQFLFFTHQSYQEFLAAQYAAEHPQEIDAILAQRWHPKWAEVIRFLAGLRGEKIVQRLLTDGDNIIHANLFLAARCLPEIEKASLDRVDTIKAELWKLVSPYDEDALKALAQLGKWLSATEVTSIVRCVRHWSLRDTAIKALGQMADRLSDADVATVVAYLCDEDSSVRRAAVQALAQIADRLSPADVTDVVARLGDKDEYVQETTIKALGQMADQLSDAGVATVVAYLRYEDWIEHRVVSVRVAAVKALGQIATRLSEVEVTAIAERLGDDHGDVRVAAVKVLGQMADRLLEADTTAITACLGDKKWEVRVAAVKVLGQMADRLLETDVTAIAERLGDWGWWYIREVETKLLGEMAARLAEAQVAAIVARLGDKKRDVRVAAVKALSKMADQLSGAEVIPIVARLGADKHWSVRVAAVKELGQMADRLSEADVNAVANLLGCGNKDVRNAAAEALGQMADRLSATAMIARLDHEEGSEHISEAEVRAVIARLGDEDWSVRAAAVEALGQRLSAADVTTVVACLRYADWPVRVVAVKALGQIAAQLSAADATAVVAACLGDDKAEFVHQAAAKALATLCKQLKGDENMYVRNAAAKALGQMADRLSATAMIALLDHFDHEEGSERIPEAEVRAVVARLGDEDWSVRVAAVKALGQLFAHGNKNDKAAVYAKLKRFYYTGVSLDERKS